jgi:hypothetical protein
MNYQDEMQRLFLHWSAAHASICAASLAIAASASRMLAAALSRPAADCPDLSRFRHHCGLTLISCHIPGQRADFPAIVGQISCTLTLIDYTLMAGCAASGGCRSGVAEPTS